MTPIVCVGETLAERDAGETASVVQRQLEAVLSIAAGADSRTRCWHTSRCGRSAPDANATPEQARDVHRVLRSRVAAHDAGSRARIADSLRRQREGGECRGAFRDAGTGRRMIGGASLVAQDFLAIGRAARKET
jgi:triosephosphate isomerase